MARSRSPVEWVERFWSRVDQRSEGECWPWTGQVTRKGYGLISVGGKNLSTHRLAYKLTVGPIPDNLTLDHTCHNPSACMAGDDCPHRRCCNPAHLEPVTSRANTLRGNGPAAIHARKTHCPHGHEYTPENTYLKNGKRWCRTCRQKPTLVICDVCGKEMDLRNLARHRRTHGRVAPTAIQE